MSWWDDLKKFDGGDDVTISANDFKNAKNAKLEISSEFNPLEKAKSYVDQEADIARNRGVKFSLPKNEKSVATGKQLNRDVDTSQGANTKAGWPLALAGAGAGAGFFSMLKSSGGQLVMGITVTVVSAMLIKKLV